MIDYISPYGKHFDYDNCYKWSKTFAWLPKKTISGNITWFKTIYMQRFYTSKYPPIGQNYRMEPVVEYAEFIDLLKEQHIN